MLTLNARKSARLSVSKLTAKHVPVAPELDFSPEPPVDSTKRSVFESMAAKNPAFAALVESLDLVEVSSNRWPVSKPVPLPELPISQADPVDPKVRIVANRTFKTGQAYSHDEALVMLATQAGVSEERAGRGLTMMLGQGILSLTLSQSYYLSESTPF